ncbi:chlorohydrolase/deaminase family protein [mine drainage metagenome]|uniref:Chlorohydrolase/deaminase family protein n=1 Tax=mine drainage metagenome TaxID=410659 RepID=T1BGC0_9ZZZZ
MVVKSLAVNNAIVLSLNRVEDEHKSVLVENGIIKKIGSESFDADIVIDADSKILVPGLINTHNHVAMSRFKGLLDDIKLSTFLDITFKLDSERSAEDIYNSSIIGICEMIDSGTTAFADLYYSEDIIAKAVNDCGIRGFLSWNTLDKKFTTQPGNPIDNAENFILGHKGKTEFVFPSIGVQGVYVASDETYIAARDISKRHGTIVHTHLAETREEISNCVNSTGKRPVEKLSSIGFLQDNVLAAHCVWLNLSEIRALGKNGVKVSWNSISNQKLGVGGIPPIPELIRSGTTVSLGTDSNGSNNSFDMFSLMKNSSISMKNARWDPSLLNAAQILEMATFNAAKAVGSNDIGVILEGKLADMIIIDSSAANMIPTNSRNAINNIVYSCGPQNVETVIIGGNILKDKFKLNSNLEERKKSAMKIVNKF